MVRVWLGFINEWILWSATIHSYDGYDGDDDHDDGGDNDAECWNWSCIYHFE